MLIETKPFVAIKGAGEHLPEDQAQLLLNMKEAHERRTFDVPASIWRTMFVSYAIFFSAIILATGHGRRALFLIAISIGYAIMYFGTASIMNAVGKSYRPDARRGDVVTATGKLSYGAACAQILTVPLLIASFGCAIFIVKSIVAP